MTEMNRLAAALLTLIFPIVMLLVLALPKIEIPSGWSSHCCLSCLRARETLRLKLMCLYGRSGAR